MGQRSQIYIRYKDKKGIQLIARYFGWNFGHLMVSRARQIVEYLHENQRYYNWLFDDPSKIAYLERLCDVNFDRRNFDVSSDIKQECQQNGMEDLILRDGLSGVLFGQDNNNGQLLIDVSDGVIKYAFIPYYTEAEQAMDASGYMCSDFGEDWEQEIDLEDLEDTRDNIDFISSHAQLMTPEEAKRFVSYDYTFAVFGYPF